MMRRILITGGSGYLGRHLVPIAAEVHDVVYTYHQNDVLGIFQGKQLDIRDEAAVSSLVARFRPHVIIHTAGSERSSHSDEVIRFGARHIANAAADTGARLLHLSTDVIFTGRDAPYNEDAPAKPLHAYGHAKADAETTVRGYENHVILRTSLLYGLDEMDRGTAWMVQALRDGEPVTLFNDQRRNPTWVKTLSRALLELGEHDYVGVLNVAGRQVLSRADFGLRMLDWWGVEQRDTLTTGASGGDKWPVDCELDLRRAEATLSTPLLGVDEVLSQAVRRRV
jgi:dTDP-4-dehydrorhamnose reductase